MTKTHSSSGVTPRVNPGRTATPLIDTEELRHRVSALKVAQLLSEGEGRPIPGWNVLRCPSPTHEDRHPSFHVSTRTKKFECRSCGLKGSGAFDLVMAVNGCDFMEAVHWVAERFDGREVIEATSSPRRKTPPPPPKTTETLPPIERRPDFKDATRLGFERGSQYRTQLVQERKWSDGEGHRGSRIEQFKIELVQLKPGGELRWRFPFMYRGRPGWWQDRAVVEKVRPKWRGAPTLDGQEEGIRFPFNVDRLAGDGPSVVICEGPADVVTFYELQSVFAPGEWPCVLGIPGVNNVKDRWLNALRERGKPVLVLADNDGPGQAMKKRIIDKLGDLVRADVQVPDGHDDFGDWWTAVGHEDVEERKRFVKMIEEGGRRGKS